MTDDEIFEVLDNTIENYRRSRGFLAEPLNDERYSFDAPGGVKVTVETDTQRLRNPKPGADRGDGSFSIDPSSRGVEGYIRLYLKPSDSFRATQVAFTTQVECRVGRMPSIERRMFVQDRTYLEQLLTVIKLAS